MLKKISGLFLGLIVLAGSACVTPTHASSAPQVIITKIQAASAVTAKDEFIAMYNATSQEIDITNWCLANKVKVSFACFQYADNTAQVILPAYSYATIASNEYAANRHIDPHYFSQTYAVSNQSSGSLVNSADTVTLIKNNGEVEDSWSWATAIPSGKVLSRLKLFALPDVYATTGAAADWVNEAESAPISSGIFFQEIPPAPAPDPDPVPITDPDPGPENSPAPEPTPPLPLLPLIITELLPDAVGSDTNNEFIELYNPNTIPVSLSGYQIMIGTELDKIYSFPKTDTVGPLSYYLLRNDQVKYSLNNTTSKLQLKLNGKLVGPVVEYLNPKEGETWALVGEVWQYTNQPTPGEENSASHNETMSVLSPITTTASTVLKPCTANQYRNLETGRCRLLPTATTSTRTPCKDGQLRNEETGRCRAITVAKVASECKAGQERNPDTGRCRSIAKMTKAGHGLSTAINTDKKIGTTWYMWIAVTGIVLIIIGYGVWEWRKEIKQVWASTKQRFHKVSP